MFLYLLIQEFRTTYVSRPDYAGRLLTVLVILFGSRMSKRLRSQLFQAACDHLI